MQWESEGVVLAAARLGERDLRVSVLTHDHGRVHAVVRAGASKKHAAIWQPGNHVHVHWQARLAEQMGVFRGESLTPYAAWLMQDAQALLALNAVCGLLEKAVLERDPHPQLYIAVRAFLEAFLVGARPEAWLPHYAMFEWVLLHECGFGLDLSCCAATGSTDDLIYISPKSGRAVCRTAGTPYHAKMLPLTRLIAQEHIQGVDTQDALRTLEVTGYFLQHWLFAHLHQRMPDARHRLCEALSS